MTSTRRSERRVAVVTGGGGGIGAAVASELGRRGVHVVTVDPMVTVDGAEQVGNSKRTTAERIQAAGGSAQASTASVSDRDAVQRLFGELVAEHGRVDAVVNVAGITRPTGFATGDDADWAAVLSVHLDGYRNVLDAALPSMAEAGRGHVLGVTSGSGWRAADAGAYSCAKRAVAALTWQLGAVAPPGVSVNAISPIAMTRMVAAAMERAGSARPGGSRATGGLSLAGMPEPDELAPLAAHLVDPGFTLRGTVLFAGGSEVAVVDPPRLIEVVRTRGVTSIASVLAGVSEMLANAETAQATTGGANPRFAGLFDTGAPAGTSAPVKGGAAVVSDRPEVAGAIAARFGDGGMPTRSVPVADVPAGFDAARAALRAAAVDLGGLATVVVALGSSSPATGGQAAQDWQAVMGTHAGLVDELCADAAWARAASDVTDGPVRLVQVVDATSPGGRSRAQAVTQLSRAARRATDDRVAAFAVAVEDPAETTVAAHLVHHLATAAPPELSGAELAVGAGWVGLRRHPMPGTGIVFGGPDLPDWFDEVLAAR